MPPSWAPLDCGCGGWCPENRPWPQVEFRGNFQYPLEAVRVEVGAIREYCRSKVGRSHPHGQGLLRNSMALAGKWRVVSLGNRNAGGLRTSNINAIPSGH